MPVRFDEWARDTRIAMAVRSSAPRRAKCVSMAGWRTQKDLRMKRSMRRSLLVAVVLLCLGAQSSLLAGGSKNNTTKETTIDLSSKKNVFVGWVDLSPDQWSLWGYGSKDEWTQVINDLNHDFQSSCQGQYLAGRKVTAAKDSSDESLGGNDLYIKFSDVNIDTPTMGFGCRYISSIRRRMLKSLQSPPISITRSAGSSSSCTCVEPWTKWVRSYRQRSWGHHQRSDQR